MSIEAMKQALKFCEEIGDLRGPYPFVNETSIVSDSRKVLKALRQAIAEAEKQEPVAWIVDGEIKVRLDMAGKLYYSETNVYTSPPKREWVGLTDEDIDLYAFDIGVTDNKAPAWLVTYARGIEAKLKEKNVPQP
jgi:hypothetical protein